MLRSHLNLKKAHTAKDPIFPSSPIRKRSLEIVLRALGREFANLHYKMVVFLDQLDPQIENVQSIISALAPGRGWSIWKQILAQATLNKFLSNHAFHTMRLTKISSAIAPYEKLPFEIRASIRNILLR